MIRALPRWMWDVLFGAAVAVGMIYIVAVMFEQTKPASAVDGPAVTQAG